MTDAGLALALVDGVIVLTVVEGLALALLHRSTGRGPPPRAIVANLGAGLALLLAAHAGASGAPMPWLPLWLAAAGAAHLVDLRERWRRSG